MEIIPIVALLSESAMWWFHRIRRQDEQADQARLQQLIAEAEWRWPRITREEALGALYAELLRNLTRAAGEGLRVTCLRRDLRLIAEEDERLLREEADRESSFRLVSG